MSRDCGLEIPHVAGDPFGIEADLITGADQGIVAQRLALTVQALAQQMTRARAVALRPESRHEILATGRMRARESEQREQRDPRPLNDAAVRNDAGFDDTRTAEEPNRAHVRQLTVGRRKHDRAMTLRAELTVRNARRQARSSPLDRSSDDGTSPRYPTHARPTVTWRR